MSFRRKKNIRPPRAKRGAAPYKNCLTPLLHQILFAEHRDVRFGDAQHLHTVADDAAVTRLHLGNDALHVLALDAHEPEEHLLEFERDGRDQHAQAVDEELFAAEAAGSEIILQDVLLLYAEERFEEHRADARAVLSARAVPQQPVALHRKAEKAAQTLLRLLVEDDAAVGVDHVIIRRAELLLDAAALRLDEEAGGALRRDAARGRAEKGQRDVFGALEKGVGMFAALGIRAQIDDGADAEPFERRLRALGEAGEPAAPEELARFDGAVALRRDAAEIARIVELFEFQPLDLHTPSIVREEALFVKRAASAAREKRKTGGTNHLF